MGVAQRKWQPLHRKCHPGSNVLVKVMLPQLTNINVVVEAAVEVKIFLDPVMFCFRLGLLVVFYI